MSVPGTRKNISNKSAVKAIIIKGASNIAGTKIGPSISSKDEFEGLYDEQGLMEPIYDPLFLSQIVEYNNMLRQCIDAYKTNIAGFGFALKYAIDVESDIYRNLKYQADEEWEVLTDLYKHCNFNKTFEDVLKRAIDDRESCGYGIIEVIPRGNGKPGGFEHVPSHTIRMTRAEPIPIPVKRNELGINGKIQTITYSVRFRRFCQILSSREPVWFKEFGDPRRMNRETGEYEDKPNGRIVPADKLANSLIFMNIYSAYTSYGLPRYLGNLLSIFGSRKSEELNYYYFYNGKHVPMAILISNGSLTESSLTKLEEYATNLKGTQNAHGYLILEASGFEDDEGFGESNPSNVGIELKPLTEAIQEDGLFQTYDGNNRAKVRSSFRLPPLYTGESQDYTRSTADTARQMAEEQIFAPERYEIASKFNKLINSELGVYYVEMYLKGPRLSSLESISKAITPLNNAGAVTPNMLVDIVGELLDKDLEQFPREIGNIPIKVLQQLLIDDRIDIKIPGVEIKSVINNDNKDPEGDDATKGGKQDVKN